MIVDDLHVVRVRALAGGIITIAGLSALRMCICSTHGTRPHLLPIKSTVLDSLSSNATTFDRRTIIKHLIHLICGQWYESFCCKLDFTALSLVGGLRLRF